MLGAGGFIGRALSARLAARNVLARTVTRANSGTLDANTDWPALLDGARIVVHLASAAAAPRDRDGMAKEIATAEALGRAARRCGIARMILMSSIKAMGDITGAVPFAADTPAAPIDRYGRTKLAIEQALADAPGLAILRPPLVYGPEVKGSFRLLLAAAARGLPLPIASIRNRRAFLFIDNLLDVIEALLAAEAPGGVFLMRDDEEVATPELLRRLARQMGHPAHLFPCPPVFLRTALSLMGRGDVAAALIDSLTIDDSATRTRLGWRPRISLDDGLVATGRWFCEAAL